jgi:TPR repeat protein
MNKCFSVVLLCLIMMFCIACVSTQSNQLKIQQLAEHGDAGAQYDLGWKYFKGEGVPKDDVQAVAWFRKAADQGHANAQYIISITYHYGQGGLAKDDVQAVMWLRKAADQGHSRAQYKLAWMYAYGEGGLAKDDIQAVAWFRKAADQGDADAQYTLGAMYGLGKGVAMDVVQSYMWIELAANQGHAKAIDARKKITEVLTTSQIEEGQRLSREWSAAHHKSNGQLDLELRRF